MSEHHPDQSTNPPYPPLTAPGSTPPPAAAPPSHQWGAPPGPPPGQWVQHPGQQPAHQPAQQPGQPWGGPPTWAPVHKPGIVALRPLRLGDLYDGAFKAIRQNPRVMLGMAIVLVTGFLLLPSLVSVLMAAAGDLSGPFDADSFSATTEEQDPTQGIAAIVMSYVGNLLALVAGLMLTGLVVHVVAEAVLGRRTSFGQAWTAVRGRLLRLVGVMLLSLLVVLLVVAAAVAVIVAAGVTGGTVAAVVAGFVAVPAAVVAIVWLQVRFFLLAPPALVLERLGVVASMRRSYRLTAHQFWRTFGIYLLTTLVVGVAGSMLAMPFSILAVVGGLFVPEAWAGLVYVLATYVGLVLTQALTTPFTAAVVALQYVDQRIRKEGFDIELISASGALPPTHHLR
ncbi:DUF7544 domain-containing protein [Nocardioides caldifontis]|uniref:DUF7544 domain-containing protein n=1 Tax=Nocardioides caldifontis TaxID=2588938 RepID=UPI0011DFDA7B|nr:hypothetical protein [Nocardioides caldifontis]